MKPFSDRLAQALQGHWGRQIGQAIGGTTGGRMLIPANG
jgi:hypothetical protein